MPVLWPWRLLVLSSKVRPCYIWAVLQASHRTALSAWPLKAMPYILEKLPAGLAWQHALSVHFKEMAFEGH